MGRTRYARCLPLLCLLLACAAGSRADTIVLKNGRRIPAIGISRENGKVSYETPAGQLSLPESIVERIEKDNAGLEGFGARNPQAADLKIVAPRRDADHSESAVASLVVHDGRIDRDALARFDGAASDSTEDAQRAAEAEYAASQFALDQGILKEARGHAEKAAAMAPSQVSVLLQLAYLRLRNGEDAAALDVLARARRIEPDSADVAKLTGWADYALNRLPQAVEEWKRAQQLRPQAEVAEALEKAERDLSVESRYREGQSAHFVVRYYGGAAPDLAQGVLRLLEGDFQEIAVQLKETPAEPIAVVLYTSETFSDVTRAPNWVNALNDGRIRIPVQGLDTVTPELARVLKHELAHTFIALKTRERSPVWLHEGVAQWIEGRRSEDSAALLVDLYDHHEDPSLVVLEKSWMSSDRDFAGVAYAWSLAVIEAIAASGGPSDVERLLDRVNTEHSTEAAAQAALRMNYADLNRFTAEYLRRTYVH
jgi:hypothetical protein